MANCQHGKGGIIPHLLAADFNLKQESAVLRAAVA
jgi:hypothetical protein